MVIPEFADSDIITKPHLPRHLLDITYARGATHIKKSIEERQHIHQVIIVNALTYFGTQTEIFLDLDTQKFYAEIRSAEHPQYDFGPQDQPPTPIGYDGKWFINKMNPPMWEFNGNRMRRGASEEGNGQNSSPQRHSSDSLSQRQSPNTRRRYDQTRVPDESDPNPSDSNDGNAGRDRRRDDRGRDRNRDHDRDAHWRRTGGGRRDPSSDPSDPSDPDDDDIYGCRRSRQNRDDRRRDCRRDRSTRQPTPIVDKSTVKLSSSTLGFFDPDKDSVHSFCDQLSLMTELYDDAAIIALIPGSLVGRAKSWFLSRSMPRRKMRTVEGWIKCLTDEFQINTAVAKEQASKRKYTPEDKSVMDYFYTKTELCRSADRKIKSKDLIDEIWNGLPPDF